MHLVILYTPLQATKNAVEMDSVLLEKFKEAVKEVMGAEETSGQTTESVHSKLLWKVYNTRCNEFLRSITKLACIQQNKAVDADTGLRDKLKVYAVERKSIFNDS